MADKKQFYTACGDGYASILHRQVGGQRDGISVRALIRELDLTKETTKAATHSFITGSLQSNEKVARLESEFQRGISAVIGDLLRYRLDSDLYKRPKIKVDEITFKVDAIILDSIIKDGVVLSVSDNSLESSILILDLRLKEVTHCQACADEIEKKFAMQGLPGYSRSGANSLRQKITSTNISLLIHELFFSGMGSRGIRVTMVNEDSLVNLDKCGPCLYLHVDYISSDKSTQRLFEFTVKRGIKQSISEMLKVFDKPTENDIAFLVGKETGNSITISIPSTDKVVKIHSIPNSYDLSSGRLNMDRFVDKAGDFILPVS